MGIWMRPRSSHGLDQVLSDDIMADSFFQQFDGYQRIQLSVILMDYSEISFLIQN